MAAKAGSKVGEGEWEPHYEPKSKCGLQHYSTRARDAYAAVVEGAEPKGAAAGHGGAGEEGGEGDGMRGVLCCHVVSILMRRGVLDLGETVCRSLGRSGSSFIFSGSKYHRRAVL